ncbi:hypothetical protein F442_00881 [Phytophthora nicotianae P10297]|uniref:Uncharacterized protein n=2 Tax=Phytophthora nicotianae TaxID=4792 RepID=V9G0L4_PHYNI|nr:hypothetical protein F443_00927 [Phytophthora nicotianae P1569]ETP54376.1 hypothetical protein F442_00881 [Phytophthora nicotianae P10297]
MATEQAQTMLVAAMYADAVLAQGSFASGPVDRWQRCRCAGGMELVAVLLAGVLGGVAVPVELFPTESFY